jgi:hypothetical protein
MSIWQLRNKGGKGRIGLGCTSIIGIGVQRGIRMEWSVTGEGSLVLGRLVAWLLGWLLGCSVGCFVACRTQYETTAGVSLESARDGHDEILG